MLRYIDIEKSKNDKKLTEYDGYTFHNLNNAEISLFINHIEILKNKNNYKSGNFLILESDIYVYPGFNFTHKHLNEILDFSKNLPDWDK